MCRHADQRSAGQGRRSVGSYYASHDGNGQLSSRHSTSGRVVWPRHGLRPQEWPDETYRAGEEVGDDG